MSPIDWTRNRTTIEQSHAERTVRKAQAHKAAVAENLRGVPIREIVPRLRAEYARIDRDIDRRLWRGDA